MARATITPGEWYEEPYGDEDVFYADAGEEVMDQGFAVFNLHMNDAGRRADREFMRQYGQRCFRRVIMPLYREGIMTILDTELTPHRAAWVALVTAYVNERSPA